MCIIQSCLHPVFPGVGDVLQGIGVSALPPGLAANTTELQVVDLYWLYASGGTLPTEYGAWTKLAILR
jgi:hypothetical protein